MKPLIVIALDKIFANGAIKTSKFSFISTHLTQCSQYAYGDALKLSLFTNAKRYVYFLQHVSVCFLDVVKRTHSELNFSSISSHSSYH
jgi:hypothetical protein